MIGKIRFIYEWLNNILGIGWINIWIFFMAK